MYRFTFKIEEIKHEKSYVAIHMKHIDQMMKKKNQLMKVLKNQ